MFHLRKVGLMLVDYLACIYLRFFLFSYYVDLKVTGPIKNVFILVFLCLLIVLILYWEPMSHMDLYKKNVNKQLNVLNFSPSLEIHDSMSIDDYIDTTMKSLLLCFHTRLLCYRWNRAVSQKSNRRCGDVWRHLAEGSQCDEQ